MSPNRLPIPFCPIPSIRIRISVYLYLPTSRGFRSYRAYEIESIHFRPFIPPPPLLHVCPPRTQLKLNKMTFQIICDTTRNRAGGVRAHGGGTRSAYLLENVNCMKAINCRYAKLPPFQRKKAENT